MAWYNRFFFGTGYSDTLIGNDGNNWIFSFSGNDTIYAGGGNDAVFAGSGCDFIDAGSGNDYVNAGSGNDEIYGGSGHDRLFGGNGDDFISGGSGNDRLVGGSGDDFITGGTGHDDLYGGRGNDTLIGGQGSDFMYGGSGHDTLVLTSALQTGEYSKFNGGSGVDTLVLNLSAEEFASQETADDLLGYLAHIDANMRSNGLVWGPRYYFNTLNLHAYAIENLRVFVDGVEVDPADAGPGDPTGNDPVAVNDDYSADENDSVAANVTDNDTLDAGTTVTLISGVANGALVLNTDGSFTFEPGTDFDSLGEGDTASVSFTYEVSGGGQTNQATATITITGTNDAPIVSAPVTAAVSEGSAATVNLLDGASDVDAGDTLSIILEGALPAGLSLDGTVLTIDATDPAYDALAAGENIVLTINYSVNDANGGSAAQTATITISGTNDAPIVAATLSAAAVEGGASLTLDLLDGASDVDNGASLSVTGLPEVLPEGISVVGSTLTIDPSNAAYDALALDETTTITVDYLVSDETGATVAQTAAITLTGTNDAPIVAATLSAAASEGDAEITLDLLAGASDVDNGATLSVTGLPEVLPEGISISGSTLTFDPSNAAYDVLAAGEEAILTVDYFVTDEHGAAVAQSATLTLTGTNDAPAVEAALTASASEGDAAITVDLLEGASDVDNGAVLSISSIPLVLPDGVSISGTSLTFDPAHPAYDSLALNETATITVGYSVSDGNADVAQTLTLTVTGTNDAPVVEAALSAAANEGDAAITLDLLDGASDVDNGAILSVTGLPEVLPEGVSVTGSTLTFDPNDAAFDALAMGEETTITVDYFVSDEHGDSVNQTATITVTGTNDTPIVDAALSAEVVEGEVAITLELLAGVSDVDNGAVLSVTGLPEVLPDGVSIVGSTLTFDPSDAAYDALALDEETTLTIEYFVSDEHGATTAQSATLTITGTNDMPVVDAAITANASEGDAAITLDLLDGASDVDNGAVLSVTGLPEVLPEGVSVVGSTLTFDPSDAAYDALAEGEEEIITIDYLVSDEIGASVAQSATITLTGTNDAPVVAAALSQNTTEDAASITVDLLEGASDVDNGATLQVDGASVTGLRAGLTLLGNTLTIDPADASFQSLSEGQTLDIEIGYAVMDELGAFVAQTLTLTVTGTNDVPVVSRPQNITINEDAFLIPVIDLLDGITDVDENDTLTIENLTGVAAGIDVQGDSVFVDPSQYEYLAEGESELITLSYDVNDSNGGIVSQTVNITITGSNDAPIVDAALVETLSEDAFTTTFDLLEGASDVDISDTLSLTLADGATLPDGFTLEGTNLLVNARSVAALQALNVDDSQDFVIDFVISDGSGGSVAQSITVTVTGANDRPTITNNVRNVVTELDVPFSLTLPEDQFSDVDTGDSFTVSVASSDGSPLPSWLTYDAVSRTLSGTPGQTETGIYNISVTATDANGGVTSDTFSISVGADFIIGTEAGETLNGTNAEETLIGLGGDDTLIGGRGADRYVFNEGDGNDIVDDNGLFGSVIDVAEFVDYALADATFTRVGSSTDFIISFANGDSVRINDSLYGGGGAVDLFQFTDQTVDLQYVRERLITESQTDGDDTVVGTFLDDALEGGLGNDTLSGLRGSDTYTFNVGDGNDIVDDQGLFGSVIDTIIFTGYDLADASFARIGTSTNYIVSFANGDSVQVNNSLYGGGGAIDILQFADQSVDIQYINERLIAEAQTDGDDTVYGTFSSDALEGGLGNDILIGLRGADTYTFNSGDGNDIVDDNGLFGSVIDTLIFTDYALADASFSRIGTSDDYLITFANGDSVEVRDSLNGGGGAIDIVQFTDQSVDLDFVRTTLIANSQTDGDDTVTGYQGADTLEGGLGNDLLVGGRGADLYIFNVGDGQDTVDDNGLFSSTIDVIEFTGYASTEASYERIGSTDGYIVSFANGDQITVIDSLLGGGDAVDILRFTDMDIDLPTLRDIILTQAQTAGDDIINGYTGDDSIDGGDGNDTINSSNGNDTVSGGSGDDTINAGSGNDIVAGDAGDDIINASSGNDTITGGTGNDNIIGGSGLDTYIFNAGDGNDVIEDNGNSGQDDTLRFTDYNLADAAITDGGSGDILISFVNGDSVRVVNGASSRFDRIENFEFADQTVDYTAMLAILAAYQGTDANDTINGTFAADILSGGLGDDALSGFAGDDSLSGGEGKDTLVGGDGLDSLSGGNGNDTLTGGADADILDGGAGMDTYIFASGDGADLIVNHGVSGETDMLQFTDYASSDAIFSQSGNDLLVTLAGGDSVLIEDALFFDNDTVSQFIFTDQALSLNAVTQQMINAQQTDGDDLIEGFNNDNVFTGGLGNDGIRGGRGDDLYVFELGDGMDTIADRSGNDTLEFTGYASTDVTVANLAGDLVLTFDNGDSVTIINGVGFMGGPLEPLVMNGIDGDGEDRFSQEVETFIFDDTTLSLSQLLDLIPAPVDQDLIGDDGDNVLTGDAGDDTLEGGLGNDVLIGGSGDDVYFYSAGDGNDLIIEDFDIFGGFDELIIFGYSEADMLVEQDFETGLVTLTFSATDSVSFDADFFGTGLEGIVFVNDPNNLEDDVFISVFDIIGGGVDLLV